MRWNDLRAYLAQLERLGELEHVRGADWENEIGLISELMIERSGPALLFDDIPGYPAGHRVLVGADSTAKRSAILLGLDADKPIEQLAQDRRSLLRKCEPIPRQKVSTGPVFENTVQGDAVDLFRFPTPKWHDQDGQRYIGTGVCVIQRDPDSGFVNSGSYRVGIDDRSTCTVFMERGRHGDIIRRKVWARGERCPVLISVGQEPIITWLSGTGRELCPEGVSEFDVAGYFQGSPYEVVEAPITGLPMPATAEIVLEGFMPSPEEIMSLEGPFGEWPGYYGHGRRPETIVQVAAVYHRNQPIIYGHPPTRPLRDYRPFGDHNRALEAQLGKAGIEGIRGAYTLAWPGLTVIAMTQLYDGHVQDVIRVVEPGGEQYSGNHTWVLVDDDIDITSPREVLWAIASRLTPEHGVSVIPGQAYWQLDPRIPPWERSEPDANEGRRTYSAHNLVLNCCRPFQWKDEFPPVNMNSRESRLAVEAKWRWLFDRVSSD